MPAQHAAEETDLQVGTAKIAASMKGLVVTWHQHVMGASQATGIGFSFRLTVRKDPPVVHGCRNTPSTLERREATGLWKGRGLL